jgi:hypothetical protein
VSVVAALQLSSSIPFLQSATHFRTAFRSVQINAAFHYCIYVTHLHIKTLPFITSLMVMGTEKIKEEQRLTDLLTLRLDTFDYRVIFNDLYT